jgi:hypothetical protein
MQFIQYKSLTTRIEDTLRVVVASGASDSATNVSQAAFAPKATTDEKPLERAGE